jgi:hypothetical protein
MYLAQSLVDGLVCPRWGMLFVALVEGRLWMAELDGFGSWWRRNGVIGNMKEVVYGSLMDILVLGGSVGTKGSMMIMNVMVVASVLCG